MTRVGRVQSLVTLAVSASLLALIGLVSTSQGNRPLRPVFTQSDCRVTEENLARLAVDMLLHGLATGSDFYLRSSTTPTLYEKLHRTDSRALSAKLGVILPLPATGDELATRVAKPAGAKRLSFQLTPRLNAQAASTVGPASIVVEMTTKGWRVCDIDGLDLR